MLRGAERSTWEPKSSRGPELAAVLFVGVTLSLSGVSFCPCSPPPRPRLFALSFCRRPDRCTERKRAAWRVRENLTSRPCLQSSLCVDRDRRSWPGRGRDGLAAAQGTAREATRPTVTGKPLLRLRSHLCWVPPSVSTSGHPECCQPFPCCQLPLSGPPFHSLVCL